MTFFVEIDLTMGCTAEIVARRSGVVQIENILRPSARLPTCNVAPEAPEFDTSALAQTNSSVVTKM